MTRRNANYGIDSVHPVRTGDDCWCVALSFLRSPQWHNDAWDQTASAQTIALWSRFQKNIRNWNNLLIGSVGVALIVAAFVPAGRIRLGLWLLILVGVFTILLLGSLDSLASFMGYRQSVPESARQALARREPNP